MIVRWDEQGRIVIAPLDGSPPRVLPGPPEANGTDLTFSADGRFLFVIERTPTVTRVFRRVIATGRREFWKEISASDPAGVTMFRPLLARDGTSWVAACWWTLTNLYLVEGLK